MSEEIKDIETSVESKNATSSYRSIFKATSIFGGVEFFKILIGIIRSKLVAVLLGPSGMGIMNLFHSGTDMVKAATSFGLSQSAVRDVSEANATGDTKRIGRTMTIVRKLVWFTGLLGVVVVILFSPILSKSSFGNYNYILSFILLSVVLLFDQISDGQKVILRGTRKLRYLARASVIGLTAGLFITVPIYYFWNVKGIVPATIINSFIVLLISWFYSNKVKYEKVTVRIKEAFKDGKVMIKMGIALSLSTILTAVTAYIFRSFLSATSGTAMVGYYSIGVTITTTYVGMIFSAMNADFYPRLVASVNNRRESNTIVSQQGEVGSLILGPAIVACLIFMPFIIMLLYSKEFIMTSSYVTFAIIGMMFKLIGWLSSIVFVAHGDAKVFAINETCSNAYFLLFNMLGFKLGGLVGVGISFIVAYAIYFIHIYTIAKRKYGLAFNKSFVTTFLMQLLFVFLGLVIVLLLNGWIRYLIGSVFLVFVSLYSLSELNKRIGLLGFIKNRFSNEK